MVKAGLATDAGSSPVVSPLISQAVVCPFDKPLPELSPVGSGLVVVGGPVVTIQEKEPLDFALVVVYAWVGEDYASAP